MRKWAKQGFLNPADSNDDGWYKFSIRPKKDKWRMGLGIQYIISDCSNKAYLEFEPDQINLDGNGRPHPDRVDDAKRVLVSIKTRRKKIKDFAAAVALSAEKIEEALDSYEEQVIAVIKASEAALLDNDQ